MQIPKQKGYIAHRLYYLQHWVHIVIALCIESRSCYTKSAHSWPSDTAAMGVGRFIKSAYYIVLTSGRQDGHWNVGQNYAVHNRYDFVAVFIFHNVYI
jgi:hypothetical protein